MNTILTFWNIILKVFWPILKHLINPDKIIKNQNNYNDEEPEAKSLPIDQALQKANVCKDKTALDKIIEFTWAVSGNPIVTSKFGSRWLKWARKKRLNFHNGVDLIANDFNVYAPEDIIIKKVLQPDNQYPAVFIKQDGNWIKRLGVPKGRAWTPYIIAVGVHTNFLYKFKHTEARKEITAGRHIVCGTLIAHYGQFGYCMGAHLHFEIWQWVAGKAKHVLVNPFPLLKGKISKYQKQHKKQFKKDGKKWKK